MTISVIQSVEGSTANSATFALTLTGVTAGNTLLFAWSSWEPNPQETAPSSITDSQSGTWDLVVSRVSGLSSDIGNYIYKRRNVASGTITVTITQDAGSYHSGALLELTPLAATDGVTASDASASSTTRLTGTTATKAQADAFVLGIMAVSGEHSGDTNMAWSVPAGRTEYGRDNDAWNGQASITAGQVVSTTAAESMSSTIAVARQGPGIIAVFHEDAGGGGPAITYVGGQTAGFVGSTSDASITFSLTGGSDSTPQAGDLVIVSYMVGTSGRNPTLSITGNNSGAYINRSNVSELGGSTYDSKLSTFWQIMGATPDTSITRSATGNAQDGGSISIRVYRGVDPTTPFDVADATASGTSTGRANPPSITPTSAGSWIVVVGGGACSTGTTAFTSSDLTAFHTNNGPDTNDGQIGAGHKNNWSSGPFDPDQFGGGSTAAANSWAAVSMALRLAITGNTYNDSAPDSVTSEDSHSSSFVAVGSATDPVTAGEASSTSWSGARSATDSVGTSDGGTGLLSISVSSSDPVGASDSGTGSFLVSASSEDSVSSSDLGLSVLSAVGQATESVTVSEGQSSSKVTAGSGSDLTSASDSGSGLLTMLAPSTDSISVGDSGTGEIASSTYNESRTDSAAASDAGTGVLFSISSATDSAPVSDSHSVLLVAASQASDSAGSSDSGLGLLAIFGAGSDSVATSDSGLGEIGSQTHNVSGTDFLTVSDSGLSTMSRPASASESATTSDSGVGVSVISSVGSEATSAADLSQVTAAYVSTAADPVGTQDSGPSLLVTSGVADDPVSVSDSGTVEAGNGVYDRAASDAVSAGEAGSEALVAFVGGTDAASASDGGQASRSIAVSVSEPVTSQDSGFSILDALGLGSDILVTGDLGGSLQWMLAYGFDVISTSDHGTGMTAQASQRPPRVFASARPLRVVAAPRSGHVPAQPRS